VDFQNKNNKAFSVITIILVIFFFNNFGFTENNNTRIIDPIGIEKPIKNPIDLESITGIPAKSSDKFFSLPDVQSNQKNERTKTEKQKTVNPASIKQTQTEKKLELKTAKDSIDKEAGLKKLKEIANNSRWIKVEIKNGKVNITGIYFTDDTVQKVDQICSSYKLNCVKNLLKAKNN
jgi:uncharacterized membrane-anchored protein